MLQNILPLSMFPKWNPRLYMHSEIKSLLPVNPTKIYLFNIKLIWLYTMIMANYMEKQQLHIGYNSFVINRWLLSDLRNSNTFIVFLYNPILIRATCAFSCLLLSEILSPVISSCRSCLLFLGTCVLKTLFVVVYTIWKINSLWQRG